MAGAGLRPGGGWVGGEQRQSAGAEREVRQRTMDPKERSGLFLLSLISGMIYLLFYFHGLSLQPHVDPINMIDLIPVHSTVSRIRED